LVTVGNKNFTHDANGNLTQGGNDSFAWDFDNHLTETTVGTHTASYTYDGGGVRVGASVDGSAKSYLVDTQGGLPVLVDDGSKAYLHAGGVVAEVGPAAIRSCSATSSGRSWSELADARLTPEVMYHRWKGTVEALESSYDFWKLQRALSARDALQDAISLVPPSARQSLIDLVAALDDRFEVSTERVPSPSYGGRSSWKKASWWWYRIPRQRGPRLESDFGPPGLLPQSSE
jgi:hypothetical protein